MEKISVNRDEHSIRGLSQEKFDCSSVIAERSSLLIQNDMGDKRNVQTSPKSSKSKKNQRSPRRKVRDIKQGGNSIRIIQERKVQHGCCYNEERQKGIGAVLFTLGIPSIIAGLIMTIVSATDDEESNKYPKAFAAIGPILLVLAVIFFCCGILLHSMYLRTAILNCLSFDDPKGFCRVRCPTISQFLHPDDTIVINQAAIKALQSEPGKSVLKRNRLPSETPSEPPLELSKDTSYEYNDVFDEENISRSIDHSKMKKIPRGVRFSDGDESDVKRKRPASNGSVLSLKHCKISPKDEIWWTEEQNTNRPFHIDGFKEDSSQMETTEL